MQASAGARFGRPRTRVREVRSLGSGERVLGVRGLAIRTKAALAAAGLGFVLADGALAAHPTLAAAGFALIASSALLQLFAARLSWSLAEELVGPVACLLVIGVSSERVTAVSIIWLAAVATGVIARQGRVHLVTRLALVAALLVPVASTGSLTSSYAALLVAALALLATCVRVMRDLDGLLARARYDADHDDLTGVLSRGAFRQVLERAASQAEEGAPMSLLLIDLDGFGSVNKVLGHACGDALLAAAANRMSQAGTEGCVLGRLGGDEFALIVPDAAPMSVAQRVLANLRTCDECGQRALSGCIGIAQAPFDGGDADALLVAADFAMREAKRSHSHGEIVLYAADRGGGSLERRPPPALSRRIDAAAASCRLDDGARRLAVSSRLLDAPACAGRPEAPHPSRLLDRAAASASGAGQLDCRASS